MTESLASRMARASKPGHRPTRTRTVQGLKLLALGGGAWTTTMDNDGFTFTAYENTEGGWVLWGADPARSLWFRTLAGAVAFVVRIKALVALHEVQS